MEIETGGEKRKIATKTWLNVRKGQPPHDLTFLIPSGIISFSGERKGKVSTCCSHTIPKMTFIFRFFSTCLWVEKNEKQEKLFSSTFLRGKPMRSDLELFACSRVWTSMSHHREISGEKLRVITRSKAESLFVRRLDLVTWLSSSPLSSTSRFACSNSSSRFFISPTWLCVFYRARPSSAQLRLINLTGGFFFLRGNAL